MKAFSVLLLSLLVFVNGQGPIFTDEPATDEPVTEQPVTESPVVTEKPKKCHCVCQWKKCNKAMQDTEGKRECYASLKTCVQEHCNTQMCDGQFDACKEKESKGGKSTLKCEKRWKRCFRKKRAKMCHKKHQKHGDHDEYAPPPPPPAPPGGEEPPIEGPPTDEPPTEAPPTEIPVTEAPATKKPHKGPQCVGKFRKCMKAADSVDGKRDCYAGLKSCVQGRPCDTQMCDSMMAECMEKATPKQKEKLRCERRWKKCFMKNRKQMCRKKGTHDDIEGPPTDKRGPFDEVEGPPTDDLGPYDEIEGPPTDDRGPFDEIEGPPTDKRGPFDEVEGPPTDDLGPYDEIEGPSTDFPPVGTEEPFPPTEQPTEEPFTEKPKPEKPHCIGKWKKCMHAADSVDGKRDCYTGLKSCFQGRHCDTEKCDTAMTACMEKATPKQKKHLKCEKRWKRCFKKHRKRMCHKKGF